MSKIGALPQNKAFFLQILKNVKKFCDCLRNIHFGKDEEIKLVPDILSVTLVIKVTGEKKKFLLQLFRCIFCHVYMYSQSVIGGNQQTY